ncbi:MAG TPA: PAS domain S-box protein [Acidobacteriaceae bacterium]
MSDLVSLVALPAVWNGQEPRQIVTAFHDALMAMLHLDFFYIRARIETNGEPLEVWSTAPHSATTYGADEIRGALHKRYGNDPQKWPAEMRSDIGGQKLSLVSMCLGIGGEVGIVLAGSERADFPTQSERLLLGVAANQAAVGLQQALFLGEQKRVASELDRRVVERTMELAESREELQLQVEQLRQIPVVAWTLQPDGTPDFVNQVWVDYSGQTLDFVRSHPEAWMAAVHPDDREAASTGFWDGVRTGQGFDIETRFRRARDGVYRWHLNRAVAMRDAEGRVLRFVGTSTDIDDQKRAQEELRASEARLRRVIDTIPSLSWCNLPDGPNEFLSKGWHDYTGLSPEEAHGWGWAAAFHPDDLPPLMERWQELLVSGESGEIEARIRRHDGEYRWFLIRVAPFRDDTGAIIRWYGTSTDIHDRKLAEEALRASEANLRQIVDSIPGLVCTMDAAGEIEQLNQPLLDYFGKTPEELRGWKMTDAVHPDDLPEVIKVYSHSVTTGAPYDIEHRCRRADGVYRSFQVRALAVRNADGYITGWYVLLTDIEDRKRAEDALRASETNLREILDSIPGLVCTLSPAGEMELTNRPFLQYFGKTLEELKDWGNSDAVHPDDLPGVRLEFTNSITTGAPYYTEHRCRRADGVYRWFQNSARPMRDTEGRITRWYCLITDIDDRKRAEGELKRSEARHRVVVETASDAVVSIDESGSIILANPAIKRIFGYDPEALMGKPLTVLMPGGMRTLHETGFNRYLNIGVKHLDWQGTELTALRANGQEFPVEVSFGEMTVDQRRVFTGFIRDISEKKRSEEAILASRRNLSLIINTMPVLAWSALPDGTVEFFNQRWLDYTGLSPEQAQGWGWADAIHPDDLGPISEYWHSLIASGRPGEIEARLRRFDGNYRWFLFRADPMRDESGAVLKWYGTNTDIDDRKQAEEALRIRELNLLQITETIPEMLWSASPDGAIDYSNGRFLEYTGIGPEQIMRDGWMNLLHPDDVERAVEVWEACVRSGTPYGVEVRTIHAADNTYRWCVTRALPLLDQEGRIVKWHGTVVDMHDWRQAQEELHNAQAELARMTRVMTVGQLTASIAHEVNQPLSGIVTNANTCMRMLNANPPNLDGARETARRTVRDANRASDVIARLRTLFSRKEIRVEPVDINEVAREVIALYLNELQRNRVILRQELTEGLPCVEGDRIQLQQVILNLLRNASDAMSTIDDRPRELVVSTEPTVEEVHLKVRDAGVGIDPGAAERLFESFFTTKQDGMGVGLSVSRSIIEAHQGRLWVTKNNGPGATFAFSLPRSRGEHEAARQL